MKAVVAAFNQEKALVGAFSVITNLRMEFGCNFLKHYTQAQDPALLPVEVVAVGGKPGDQAATTGHTYTATSSQVQHTQYTF